jgi:hypothetical protein
MRKLYHLQRLYLNFRKDSKRDFHKDGIDCLPCAIVQVYKNTTYLPIVDTLISTKYDLKKFSIRYLWNKTIQNDGSN